MSLRLRALARALHYLGVHETPDGSNSGPLINRWLTNAGVPLSLPPAQKPWCASFAYSMFLEEGVNLRTRFGLQNPASVWYWVEMAKGLGLLRDRPFKGDLVAYSWGHPTPHPSDHIGFVEKVLGLPKSSRPLTLRNKYFVRTVEGNEANGVRRKWRWVSPDTVAFIRIPG